MSPISIVGRLSVLLPTETARGVCARSVLHAGLTPREALGFAADLRLSCGKAERCARVEQLLDQLGLRECCDTRIGNVDRRGISGGQRKRVSVGLELVTDPAVILVDEATSGLDSKMVCEGRRSGGGCGCEGRGRRSSRG
eukprot:6188184-Pleurochrysis_carterae.AAC.7